MGEKVTLPQPLFFKVARGGITTFINATHVVKIDIEAATLSSGTLYLNDGTQVELNANDADWIMRLMAYHAHEQMNVVNELKKLGGGR